MVRYIHKETGLTNLCMAGGVALNCVANGRIIRETEVKNLFVQPAAGDAGRRVGVGALDLQHAREDAARRSPGGTRYLGPSTRHRDREYLGATRRPTRRTTTRARPEDREGHLRRQRSLGWFPGRMEFGPRALGGRSILADPRDAKMRDTLNMKIKFPRGLPSLCALGPRRQEPEWFDIDCDSP